MPPTNDRRSARWHLKEVTTLKHLASKGSPAAEIALSLHRSLGAVQQKASELGIRIERATDSKWWQPRQRGGALSVDQQAPARLRRS